MRIMGHVFGVAGGLLFAWGGRWIFLHPAKFAKIFTGDPEVMGKFTKPYVRVAGGFVLFFGLLVTCEAVVPEYLGERYGLWILVFPFAAAGFLTFRVLRHARLAVDKPQY